VLTDISAMYSVLSVMGPKARELLARVSPDDLSPEALKFSWTKVIDLGFARVRAARMSYVGGPGFELYVPVEMARHVYQALHEAGAIWACGMPATSRWTPCASSRAGAPGARSSARRNTVGGRPGLQREAGQADAFIGRRRCWQRWGQPLRKKLVTLVFDDAQAFGWGGEPIVLNGETVGEISSIGWSPLAGACVALGYVRGAGANQPHAGTPAHIELWGQRVAVTLHDRWPQP
jgi:glycine cleavage system aminomethyltransferase T